MRRLGCAAVIAALMLPAGCFFGTSETAAEIDWGSVRKRDVSCLGDVEVVRRDHYDLNGDGRAEMFLIMRCLADHEPAGDQLEVIAGGTDFETSPPTKLVLQMPEAVVDRLCFAGRAAIYRVTVGGRSAVWQVTWADDAAEPGPPTPGPEQGCP